jgi:guanine nucleotide-binding protein subunit alpha
MTPGRLAGTEWCIYDVGGSRSSVSSLIPILHSIISDISSNQRAAWAPFFDDVDAIIFLAPLSCFDERLVEDPRVNRLQDSYELWKSIVSNKLLSRTQIIMFLNKHDLLQKKIERGVKVKGSVPSFGSRENTTEAVVKCSFTFFASSWVY